MINQNLILRKRRKAFKFCCSRHSEELKLVHEALKEKNRLRVVTKRGLFAAGLHWRRSGYYFSMLNRLSLGIKESTEKLIKQLKEQTKGLKEEIKKEKENGSDNKL